MKYYTDFVSDNNIKGLYYYLTKELGYVKVDDNIILIEKQQNINRVFNNNRVQVKIIDSNFSDIENIDNIKKKFNIIGKGEITNLLDTNHDLFLSGSLMINSKITYSNKKKNICFYNFIPTNKKFPNFIVSSNYKKQNKNSKNIYVLIQFKEWTVFQKKPFGTCEKVIGEIGILENEYENLLYNFHINYSNYKRKEIENYKNNFDERTIQDDIVRHDYTKQNTFSIDPEGCKDIDDAIHLEEKKDFYELGVHIADVTHFILENSYIDNEAKKRLTSIYAPHRKIDMLPNIYSEDLCSLKPMENRKAFSVILKINKNYTITDYDIIKTTIQSKKAFSYDEANHIINENLNDNEINKDLNKINFIIRKINNINSKEQVFDTHNLIEFLMVKVNQIIGEKIFHFNKQNCILRLHNNSSINTNKVEDLKLLNYLNIINSESAFYTSNFENKNINHYGLNIKCYTHFTSPIRRYIDIIIHRIMNKILKNENETNDWTNLCETANIVNKNIKKCDREIEKINFISKNISNEIIEAYITEIKPLSNKIQIYIKDIGMSFYINIFSDKLKELIICNIEDDYFEILYKDSKKQYKFNLLDKIKILVSTRIEANNMDKKCIMSLLNQEEKKIIDILL